MNHLKCRPRIAVNDKKRSKICSKAYETLEKITSDSEEIVGKP